MANKVKKDSTTAPPSKSAAKASPAKSSKKKSNIQPTASAQASKKPAAGKLVTKVPEQQKSVKKKKKPEQKKASAKAAATAGPQKKYSKNKNTCTVTFRLPAEAAPGAKSVYLVGDFNDWSVRTQKMGKTKQGDYTTEVTLRSGNAYQFRYLIDGTQWENDWNADRYEKHPYGDGDNSVVMV